MIETFVKRPATTIIFIAIFMVMGLVSVGNLIIEPTPKVEFPIITIQTVYGGASPEEIETQVLKRVEDAVSEISQIKNIQSEARDSYGVVIIQFLIEADVNIKSIEVKDKVEAIINDFPEGADRPIIAKFDPLIQPIVNLSLMSEEHSLTELYEYADKKLKTRLSAIDGVATVDLFGGQEREINVELDNNLLIQNYLSIEDVINSMARKNLNVPGGSINKKDSKVSVRFVGEFANVEDIKKLPIVSREGRTIKLSSVGSVVDSYKDVDSIARFNGKDTVGIAVKKLSDGDAVKIVKNLKQQIEIIKTEIPDGMKLDIAVDTTRITLSNTEGTVQSIFLGIILTIIILLVFLGDWRGAVIAAVVIPTSIISTFFIMDLSDYSINMMTLLAFGTCLGTLIANALIIIESIYKHLQMGKDSQTAAIEGTKEVLLAIFASSGTNLVVFTPLAFMGGIVGQFMVQFGMTVVYATIFSIMASVTLTPMLCSVLLKDPSSLKGPFPFVAKFTDKCIEWITEQYRWFFDRMMNWPILSTIIALLVFMSISFSGSRLGSEFVPKSDRDDYTVSVVMPDGTPVEKTGEIVEKVDKLLKEYSEVKSTLSDIGYDGEEKARITVSLVPAAEREKSYSTLMSELLVDLTKIPEAEFTLNGGRSNNSNLGDITIDVTGANFQEMITASNKMKNIMANSGYFGSVQSSYRIPKMEIQFNPDSSKIIRQGLTNIQIGQVIRGLVNGNDDSVYKEDGEEYDINITLGNDFKKNVEDFDSFLIHGKDGLIPIASLGEVEFTEATSPLKRRDKKSIIQLNGYLAKSNTGTVMKELSNLFTKAELPATVKYAYTGDAENQAESSRELGKAFLLAVILTYMLLVAVLNSFVFPISIGSAILTSFLGSIVLMFYTDQTVNIGSMMAMVMVVGLAVNNAILMIEYAQQKIFEGVEVKEAIWLGAKEKLKAILMTTIAIIAGTLPQLFALDKIKSAMGAVIVGGMIGSIIFTYFLVPVIHLLVYKAKDFIGRFSGKESLVK